MVNQSSFESKEDKKDRYREYLKLIYDISKHHTSLSTVTAALIAGLFQDDFTGSSPPLALYATLILFAISVALSVVAMVRVAALMREEAKAELPMLLRLLHVGVITTTLFALATFAVHVFSLREFC